MAVAARSSHHVLRTAIARDGFAFVRAAIMGELLAAYGPLDDWAAFSDSWSRLELDSYMADGGRYRRRRHAVYRVSEEEAQRLPHQPHFQTLDYNPLHGGIERWFAPIEAEIGAGRSMNAILAFCRGLFGTFDPEGSPAPPGGSAPTEKPTRRLWRVEVHQFRIEARVGEVGRPTPEGLHRDGVDHVLVLLINRQNIARGVTSIHALDGSPLGQFTLTDPLDAAIVEDTRVAHGVTPVEAIDPALPAYRDVLVVTFART